MNIYLYPYTSRSKANTSNPFMTNFVESLQGSGAAITNNECSKHKPFLDMVMLHANDTDTYILNWIEEISNRRFGSIQSIIFILFFYIQKLRGKKFVWVYHNIVSHSKEGFFSRCIKSVLRKRGDLFITLSKEAYNILTKEVNGKVLFYNHPINSDLLKLEAKPSKSHFDILIWGSILKYKGIVEFLEYLHKEGLQGKYNIFIIGKCKDAIYAEKLQSLCNNNIVFENNYVDFAELKGHIANSKYILFPYIGDSPSSSGALIDTVTMGGCSIGPEKGAFKDLEECKVCLTYTDYNSLIEIISSEQNFASENIDKFIENNSWSSFAESLKREIASI